MKSRFMRRHAALRNLCLERIVVEMRDEDMTGIPQYPEENHRNVPARNLNPAALFCDEWRELYETEEAKALRSSILRSIHERLKEKP